MIDEAAAAIRAGRPVIIPTDTVYGLATSPYEEAFVRGLYALKGRPAAQPTAVVAYDLDALSDLLPELDGHARGLAGALLPGAFTLVLPNPARRFPWLTGARPETIGVRVPALEGAARELLRQVGAVAATSANLPGGDDPRRLDEVPRELRDGAAAAVDGGELPGRPSTVVDLTGAEPLVLREGAVSTAATISALRRASAGGQ